MRPVKLTLVSQADDDNGISTTQTLAGAANLTITGALASGGVATLPGSDYVSITSAGNDSGITFRITGTDRNSAPLVEIVTGTNAGVAKTINRFLTVKQIRTSGATAGAVIAGTIDTAYSDPCPMDYRLVPFNVGLFFEDDGTTTAFKVQYSGDDPWSFANADDYNLNGTWFDHPFMTAMKAGLSGNIAFPVRAIRLTCDQSGSDTGTLTIVQAGH